MKKSYVKVTDSTMSINQAMEESGVSRTTIVKWIKEEQFKTYRQINNQILIDKESFFLFLEKKRKERNIDGSEWLENRKIGKNKNWRCKTKKPCTEQGFFKIIKKKGVNTEYHIF